METIHQQYLPVLIFFSIALGLAFLLILLPFIVSKTRWYNAKNSPYECGIDTNDHDRGKFDIRFYLVAILFIIFDLEIILLFPWAIALKQLGLLGFSSMMLFLSVLIVGFIYEWKKGALEWD